MLAQAGSGFVGFANPPAVLPSPDWQHMMRKCCRHNPHHEAIRASVVMLTNFNSSQRQHHW